MDKLTKLLIIANNHPDLFDKYVQCMVNNKEALPNHEIIHQIFSLLDLPQGWNYGEGNKIKEDVALISLIILENAPIIYENVEAFPLNDGGISLRIICKKDLTIGLLINSENNIGAYIDNGVEIKDSGVKKMSDIAEFLVQEVDNADS